MNTIMPFLALTVLLYVGRPLLVPLIIAVFFWYLTNAVGEYYNKIIKSAFAAKTLSGLSIVGVIYFFISQIQPMLTDLYHKIPEITAGISRLLERVSATLGTEISMETAQIPSVHGIAASVGSSIGSAGAVILMIAVYILFLFIEQHTFPKKLGAIFPAARQLNKISFVLKSVDSRMKKYLFVKTCVSGCTAIFAYVGMAALGVDFAIVWAFFVFILNYIPVIGSILAGAFPVIYVFALTGEVRIPILIALWITAVNVVFGNIIDPKLTGKSLNLSALAIVVNMVFWGMLWGPVGMFFSVPILVMVFVVAAQFDRSRWIAVLLSADGQIPDKKDE